jgi:hypothetical protein
MEPMAEKMLGEDPALAREFGDKLESDDRFRNNSKPVFNGFINGRRFTMIERDFTPSLGR